MESQGTTYYNYTNLRAYYKSLGIDIPDQYLRWIQALLNTKETMFTYDNLPDGLTSDILEEALIFNNFLCWYKSDKFGLVLCRYVPNGIYNLYWRPTKVQLLTLSGQNIAYDVPYDDIILCKDNKMDIIPFVTLNGYIREIIEMENSLHILVKLARFPAIVTGDKEQVGALKKMLQANADCKGFVIGDKTMANSLVTQNIEMPCKPIEMYELMEKYRNLATQSIGIYSVDEKRERIVTSEIQAGNDYTDFIYNGMVECREEWIAELNAKYGTNIVMHESYVENKQDENELMAEQAGMIADAENVEPKGDTNVKPGL